MQRCGTRGPHGPVNLNMPRRSIHVDQGPNDPARDASSAERSLNIIETQMILAFGPVHRNSSKRMVDSRSFFQLKG